MADGLSANPRPDFIYLALTDRFSDGGSQQQS